MLTSQFISLFKTVAANIAECILNAGRNALLSSELHEWKKGEEVSIYRCTQQKCYALFFQKTSP